jgi:hypothetical protein
MNKEIVTQTGQPKSKNAHIQLRLPKTLYAKLQTIAAAEGMTATAWIRRTCVIELRRKPAA